MLIDRYAKPEFAPYAMALGQFALAWNDLLHYMSTLFSIATLERAPQAGDAVNYVPTYIWHAIKSDRSQRDMLLAAIQHSKLSVGNRLAEDGKWLCDRINSLEDRRNDILHSPFILVNSRVVPNTFGKNPRAQKLASAENLLEEVKSAGNTAVGLADFSSRLVTSLLNPRAPWPERPIEEPRRKKTSAKTSR
jgi:hypothetical protein